MIKRVFIHPPRWGGHPRIAAQYAEQLTRLSPYIIVQHLTQAFDLNKVNQVYQDLEHRTLVVVGHLNDDELKQVEEHAQSIIVDFCQTEQPECTELRANQKHFNGRAVDAESLYDWIQRGK
ncbi:hypothetical protein [Pseudoalteromonas rubra]|uniref:hypothetical protein n=1 Tax=Pseudoalteromonas rubra TaxID=43658 RepID=UPI002DBC50B0|nr:hypothetical protein [Pseudoalteromonas rubra]MEC4091596.1 hypothetical protein [Pseudoalteromonas rubra]